MPEHMHETGRKAAGFATTHEVQNHSMTRIIVHDPSAIAWFIVVAYFGASILALRAAGLSRNLRERHFWTGAAALLVLLGLNKQLDLQTFVTRFGRTLARSEGWYSDRRLVQALFILLLGAVAIGCIAALSVWLRRSASAVKIALLGCVLLAGFVVMRAASFHHMDAWVTRNVAGMRSGWWLELAGILVIGISAATFGNTGRGKRF